MISVLAALLVGSLCLGQPTFHDPVCEPLLVNDPVSGDVYVYDIRSMKVPDTSRFNFSTAREAGQAWTIYLNICGDAIYTGCVASSPGCQLVPGDTNMYQLGKPSTFVLQPYFDPRDPSKTVLPLGGVFVQTEGGALCANGVRRSMHLWFKCDPNVTDLSEPLPVQEKDPLSGKPTPCTYFFDPIPHAAFCPQKQVAPPPF